MNGSGAKIVIFGSDKSVSFKPWLNDGGFACGSLAEVRRHAARPGGETNIRPGVLLVALDELESVVELRKQIWSRGGAPLEIVAILMEPRADETLHALRMGACDVVFPAMTQTDFNDCLRRARQRVLERLGHAIIGGINSVRSLQQAKKTRNEYFPLCAADDAMWDIMLFVLEQHFLERKTTVTNACLASSIPVTTGLRKVEALIGVGYLARYQDPKDRRLILLRPTDSFLERFDAYRFALVMGPETRPRPTQVPTPKETAGKSRRLQAA